MNWKLIYKSPLNQPLRGNYTEWKEQIAEECYHQCVYCAIHESSWGGIDHYQIDHFRPKSRDEFKNLENDICNLFYACPVCNRFKSDDWPGDPADLENICYPDPSKTDYSTLFDIDPHFSINGKYVSAKYLIHRLYLNRPQLIYERREFSLKNRGENLLQEVNKLIKNINDKKLTNRAFDLIVSIATHLHKRDKIRPYKLSDIRKP